MNKVKILIISILILLTLIFCTSTPSITNSWRSIEENNLNRVIKQDWYVIKISEGEKIYILSNLLANSHPLLHLEEDGRLTGYGGCNRFFGNYKIEKKKLFTTSPIGTTRRYCSGEDGEIENQLFAILGELGAQFKIEISDDPPKLKLSNNDRTIILKRQ